MEAAERISEAGSGEVEVIDSSIIPWDRDTMPTPSARPPPDHCSRSAPHLRLRRGDRRSVSEELFEWLDAGPPTDRGGRPQSIQQGTERQVTPQVDDIEAGIDRTISCRKAAPPQQGPLRRAAPKRDRSRIGQYDARAGARALVDDVATDPNIPGSLGPAIAPRFPAGHSNTPEGTSSCSAMRSSHSPSSPCSGAWLRPRSPIHTGASASVHLVPPGQVKADGKRISLTVVVVDSTASLPVLFPRPQRSWVASIPTAAPLARASTAAPTRPSSASRQERASGSRPAFPAARALKAPSPSSSLVRQARISTSASPSPWSQPRTRPPSSTSRSRRLGCARGRCTFEHARTGSIDDLHPTVRPWAGAISLRRCRPSVSPSRHRLDLGCQQPRARTFRSFPRGKVTFPVNTGVAGARVRFQVGDKTFPAVSGADGQAWCRSRCSRCAKAKVSLSTPNGSSSIRPSTSWSPASAESASVGSPTTSADGNASARIRVLCRRQPWQASSGEEVLITSDVGIDLRRPLCWRRCLRGQFHSTEPHRSGHRHQRLDQGRRGQPSQRQDWARAARPKAL